MESRRWLARSSNSKSSKVSGCKYCLRNLPCGEDETEAIKESLPRTSVNISTMTFRSPYFTVPDRKSTRLNSSHANISYAVFCLKKKKHHLSVLSYITHYHTYSP